MWWIGAIETQMMGYRIWAEYSEALVSPPAAPRADQVSEAEFAALTTSPEAREIADRAAAEVQAAVTGFAQGNGRCD